MPNHRNPQPRHILRVTHLHVIRHVLHTKSGAATLLGGRSHEHSRGDGEVSVGLLEALLRHQTKGMRRGKVGVKKERLQKRRVFSG